MVKSIVFNDEIVLYWDIEWDLPYRSVYQILVNGKEIERTKKTHFEIKNLKGNTEYIIIINKFENDEKSANLFWLDRIVTKTDKRIIDVTKSPYNAVGDGKINNTLAIQRALDDCAFDSYVYIPNGTYIVGALNVKSDTEIFIESGATLQGTVNVEDYEPKCLSRFEGIELTCYRSLLNIGTLNHDETYTTKNIVIRGGGTISGGGKPLADAIIKVETERRKEYLSNNIDYVKTCENKMTIPGRVRSKLVSVSNSENVVFSNITFQYGSAWNIHMVYSKNIITYNSKIISNGIWNGDGWDPDSTEDCTIFGCELNTADDGIAIKSGKNPEGNIINRPTKNIRIFDCHGKDGIAIGSELSGGIENIFIWDCNMPNGNRGFRIKTTEKRGGYVRNVRIRDSKLAGIRILTSYDCNNDGESSNSLTKIENIEITNASCKNLVAKFPTETGFEEFAGFIIEGFNKEEYYIENVVINNLKIRNVEQATVMPIQLKNIKNAQIKDINFCEEGRENV